MKCWRDESSYLGTVRWFWVDGPGAQGFVSANRASSHTLVPSCSTIRAYQAARWAGTKLKHNDYVGECLAFVSAAWSYSGKSICSGCNSSTTAYQYWSNSSYWSGKGTRVATRSVQAPVGAAVFWGPVAGYPEGHVAISIGDGYAISTYERSTTSIHILKISERNATHPYLGWISY